MWSILIAYALIGCFFVAERLLRQGAAARSLQEGQADRGSTRVIGAVFGFALLILLLTPLLNWLGIGYMGNQFLAWGGTIVMLAGFLLRIWASRVLGAFYTRTLRTSTEQHLITQGPYRLIRHPGYLGDLLLWLGAGLATANWITVVVITLSMVGAYWYRMQAEDAMLAAAFPQEYQSYASRTWRLIPFLY